MPWFAAAVGVAALATVLTSAPGPAGRALDPDPACLRPGSGVFGSVPPWVPPMRTVASTQGAASYYHPSLHGRRTASGARYRRHALTAAHRSLPFGTVLRVTNLENGRQVVVVVTDRGPYVEGRVLDLSEAAAKRLGMLRQGVVRVRIERIEPRRRGSLLGRDPSGGPR